MSIDHSFRDGVAAALSGDMVAAADLFEAAVEQRPQDPAVWLWRAVCAPDAAIAVYHLRKVLEIDATHAPARRSLGRLLLARGSALAATDRPGAYRALHELSGQAPETQGLWLALAGVTDDATERLTYLRRARAQSPTDESVAASLRDGLVQLAIACSRKGLRDAARQALGEAVPLAPHDLQIWLALAHVSDGPDAIEALRKAQAIAPGHALVESSLVERLVADAHELAAQGARIEAHARWIEVSELRPLDPDVWVELAALTDRPEAAIEHLEQALSVAPEHAGAAAALAEQTLRGGLQAQAAGQTEKAVDLLRRSVVLRPDNGPAWFALATLASTPEDAMTAVEHVLAADPSHADALALRDRLRATLAPQLPNGRSILIVDDSPTIRKALAVILEAAGHTVTAEADGERALAALEQGTTPDLVFLDITMPKLDGYEVCRRIRRRRDLSSLPVVMLSGKDGFFDKVRGRMAGATQYITKPFEPSVVLAAVQDLCANADRVLVAK